MTTLSQRLQRLEHDRGVASLPFYIRRWLGEPLSVAQAVRADAEWEAINSRSQLHAPDLPAEYRNWLSSRENGEMI